MPRTNPVGFFGTVATANVEAMLHKLRDIFGDSVPAINPDLIITIDQAHGIAVAELPSLDTPPPP
jgi:hypothetical protein